MAYIDLAAFGENPGAAYMGDPDEVRVMQGILDAQEPYEQVLGEARRGVGLRPGERILGVEELQYRFGDWVLAVANTDS